MRVCDLSRGGTTQLFVANVKAEDSSDLFTLLTFCGKCCQVVPRSVRGDLYGLWKFRQQIKRPSDSNELSNNLWL